MTRLFIEDKELDITEDFSHQITYAIDDLNHFDSKSTAFTKTIILAGTSNNNKLLGNIFEFANSNFTNDAEANVYYNFNASKSAKARIEINGLMAMKGILRLLQINIDTNNVEYEIALFGELGGFVSKLGAKKITGNVLPADDLDFSAYDHKYNVANITASWQDTFTYNITTSSTFTASTKKLKVTGRNLGALSVGKVLTISGTASNNGSYTITNVYFNTLWFNIYTEITFAETIVNETDSSFTISFNNPKGSGYIYPLIDYGNVSFDTPSTAPVYLAKKDYQYKAFRPALYAREYLDKIIHAAGYTWESDFCNTAFFKRLIIPNNEKGLLKRGTTDFINADISGTQSFIMTDLAFQQKLAVDTYTLSSFSINGSNNTFTFTGSSAINTKVTLNVTGNSKFINATGYIAIMRVTGGQFIQIGSAGFSRSSTFEDFNFTISGVQPFEVGDSIYFDIHLNANPRSTFNAQVNITSAKFLVQAEPATSVPYQLNETLEINRLLPKNIMQKDFFTSILKMFNLMVTEDKFIEKHLIIEPWVDFYNLNRSSYIDWSDKIDRSNVIKITPMSEANARYYQLKYKSDSDYFNEKYRKQYNEGYGDRIYDNQLEFAKDTETAEVIFAATPLVGYQGRDKVVSTIFKMNNAVEETTESVIRILQVAEISGVTSWNIINTSTSGTTTLLSTQTNYCYAGHLNNPDLPSSDLNFGATQELYFSLVSGALSNNLFNTYYSSYLAEITDKDSRLVTAKIKLVDKDIFNLDFGRFIWFDGVLYRLIKIVDYSEGELCEVQLLRVIYTTYL